MKNAKRLFAAAVILTLVFASGCASSVQINSEPPGADVTVNGQHIGTTPTSYSDTAIVGTTHQVRLEKEGYETTSAQLTRTGNLNVGALIGGLFCLFPFLWVLNYPASVNYQLEAGSEQANRPNHEVDPETGNVVFHMEPESNFVWDPAEHSL